MALRWSQEEVTKIAEMRALLKDELAARPPYPDVVGDRRLLRFLRGRQMDVEKACAMYRKFLNWRDKNNADAIRNDILYGGKTSVYEFPNAKKIISMVPQIMLAHDALDNFGNPVGMEQFNFEPAKVLKEITKEEYITFMIYMLEYKILVLEQLSEAKERAYLAEHDYNPPPSEKGYGVMLACRIIRDFNGFGMGHMGPEGRTVITWILELAVDNYPELLYKSHMINTPWMFSTIWFFVKNLLDENTIKKVTITSTDHMSLILEECPISSIPKAVGGTYEGYNRPFVFDTSNQGPFYYPGFVKPSNSSSTGKDGSSRIADAISVSLSMPLPDDSNVKSTGNSTGLGLGSGTGAGFGSPHSASFSNTPSSTNSLSRSGSAPPSHPGETLLQHWNAEDEDFSALHSKHIPEIAALFQRPDNGDQGSEVGGDSNKDGKHSKRSQRRRMVEDMREQARLQGQLNKEMKCGLEKGCFGPSFF